MREMYSCCIAVLHSGARAHERAARYDVDSTQSVVDKRAMALADALAGKCVCVSGGEGNNQCRHVVLFDNVLSCLT
jgi:hypothetical protein